MSSQSTATRPARTGTGAALRSVGEALGFDAAGYYAEHGGLALGLNAAARLAARLPGWRTPPAAVLPARLVADRPELALREVAPGLAPVPHAVKRSGLDESFSPCARRGANSSCGTTWLVPGSRTRLREVAAVLPEPVSGATRSLVLQEVASCVNGRSFLVHAHADQVVVECFTGDDVHLFVVDRRFDLVHAESTAPGVPRHGLTKSPARWRRSTSLRSTWSGSRSTPRGSPARTSSPPCSCARCRRTGRPPRS